MGLFGTRAHRREDVAPARALAATVGERAVASAPIRDGGLVVVTDRSLLVDAGGDEVIRFPWDRVVKATWNDGLGVVVGSTAPGEPTRTLELAIDEPGRVPDLVRSAVTTNILVAERITSDELGGAWVTARRVPGADEVRWTVTFDDGVDATDPERRRWADAHVLALQVSTGV
jgi:hypothetical protein